MYIYIEKSGIARAEGCCPLKSAYPCINESRTTHMKDPRTLHMSELHAEGCCPIDISTPI